MTRPDDEPTLDGIAPDLRPFAVPLDDLVHLDGNPRRGDVDAVARSYETFGQRKPIVARRLPDGTGEVIAGNHQLAAARKLGWSHVAVVWTDDDDATARAFALADNRTAELGSYDDEALVAMIRDVHEADAELLAASGWDLVDLDELEASLDPGTTPDDYERPPSLAERFGVPPFSVLDARQGYWRERHQRWVASGISSIEGRDQLAIEETEDGSALTGRGLTLTSLPAIVPDYYSQKRKAEQRLGRELERAEFEAEHLQIRSGSNLSTTGTSAFDPVLAELAVRWFSPLGGSVLDPFAGGSVRGLVASDLGRRYVGVDLRPEQIEANVAQYEARPPIEGAIAPRWIVGDSAEVLDDDDVGSDYDLVLSCPPYADLEVYSDDPADLSNMDYDSFLVAYRAIIEAAVRRLADDRFVVWVVGEVRDRQGRYRNFVPSTIQAFEDAGARYYNEAILVTTPASLAIRATRPFLASRKLGKGHQNVLVFVKGDPKAAATACGDVEVVES